MAEEMWKAEIREGLRILGNTMAEEIAQAMEKEGAYEPGLIRGLVRYIITTEKGVARGRARVNPGDLVEVYDAIDRERFIGVVDSFWEAYGYQMVKVNNPRGVMDYYPIINTRPVES